MIEEEAKKKWCPMVRIAVEPGQGIFDNRQYNGVVTSCLASNCMMWRWLDSCPQCHSIEEIQKHGCKNLSGYCGLGGKL